MGVISLQKSRYVVEPPKTPRKGYSHCMRITAGGATRQQTRSAAYNPVYSVCGASFAGLGWRRRRAAAGPARGRRGGAATRRARRRRTRCAHPVCTPAAHPLPAWAGAGAGQPPGGEGGAAKGHAWRGILCRLGLAQAAGIVAGGLPSTVTLDLAAASFPGGPTGAHSTNGAGLFDFVAIVVGIMAASDSGDEVATARPAGAASTVHTAVVWL